MINLINGDCLCELKKLEDNSIDSIVTDPPYGLAFMGKKWDYDVPSIEIWKECLRVLKPGGHLVSFGGTRTYHRMVVAIEDAGFEIRDQIMWIYGSGFPKSTNVALRIDKESGAVGNRGKGFNAAGQGISLNQNKELRSDHPDYVAPEYKTEEAKQWQGWGTALKPANEPICLARKPISEKTVASNVLKHGTGAININESRIEAADQSVLDAAVKRMTGNTVTDASSKNFLEGQKAIIPNSAQGRWPANVIFDEEAAKVLDDQTGILKSGKIKEGQKTKETENTSLSGKNYERILPASDSSEGGASRFFYVAKPSKSERNAGLEGMPLVKHGIGDESPSGQSMQRLDGREAREMQNFHPTVKPIKLMEYLCKLVTPPGGVVLDPFMGSGTTGKAAKNLGFKFVGIERELEYFEIAQKRINEA